MPSPFFPLRKKTAIALVTLLIVLVIIGYTYSPSAADPEVKNIKESRVLSMALKGAKCDDGLPDAVTKVTTKTGNVTTTSYKYRWVMTPTTCWRVGVWASS